MEDVPQTIQAADAAGEWSETGKPITLILAFAADALYIHDTI